MINLTIRTTTNASIFTAIGGATAHIANTYKALLPALPRPNPFNAAPIALTYSVGLVITCSFFAVNLIIAAIYALAKEQQLDVLTRNLLSGAIVIGAAAASGVNPVAALALIVSSIVINSLLDQHIIQLNAIWNL